MDSSPIPILKAMLPKVPLVGKTTLYHALGLSESSKHWDLRTSLIVNVLRSFIVDSPPESISKIQHISVKDPGIKGRIWVSKITLPIPPEDDIRKGLFKAIEALKEPEDAPGGYQEPDLHPLRAEWHGYRAGASKNSSPLKISEDQKYQEMMREVASPTTILYFHGGAYYCRKNFPYSVLLTYFDIANGGVLRSLLSVPSSNFIPSARFSKCTSPQ
jgi:hypothetical protein